MRTRERNFQLLTVNYLVAGIWLTVSICFQTYTSRRSNGTATLSVWHQNFQNLTETSEKSLIAFCLFVYQCKKKWYKRANNIPWLRSRETRTVRKYDGYSFVYQYTKKEWYAIQSIHPSSKQLYSWTLKLTCLGWLHVVRKKETQGSKGQLHFIHVRIRVLKTG